MTKDAIVLLMLAEAIGLTALYFLLQRLSQFTRRTWDEVPEFLRHINYDAVEKLFDPEEEQEAVAYANARRTLRCRLALAREYVQNLYHNATVVYQWGETEWFDMVRHRLDYDADTRQRLLALHREAVTFRVACRIILVKIWFWSVLQFDRWPLGPLPSVARLRHPGSLDLLQCYHRVKRAASNFASIYGEQHSQEIETLM